jgi:hypothetical protein
MGAEEKFLIPCPGQKVRDPMSMNILPEAGAVKSWIGPEGRYWRRRVNDGSVVIGTAPVPKSQEPKSAARIQKSIIAEEEDE